MRSCKLVYARFLTFISTCERVYDVFVSIDVWWEFYCCHVPEQQRFALQDGCYHKDVAAPVLNATRACFLLYRAIDRVGSTLNDQGLFHVNTCGHDRRKRSIE